ERAVFEDLAVVGEEGVGEGLAALGDLAEAGEVLGSVVGVHGCRRRRGAGGGGAERAARRPGFARRPVVFAGLAPIHCTAPGARSLTPASHPRSAPLAGPRHLPPPWRT